MNLLSKIIAFGGLNEWRAGVRREGKRLVVTNGCFDLLHAGHVCYLSAARDEGDALLVGVNSDSAVRELKGDGRPINTEEDRALVLAGLESVSAVTVFPGKRAVEFLRAAAPDVYVKGGDYTLETLDREERSAVEAAGGRIVLIPFVPGKSTSALVRRISGS